MYCKEEQMKNLQLLYTCAKTFKDSLISSEFDFDIDCLVRIYTPISTKNGAVVTAKEIKLILPNSKIIGCSGCGIIFNGKQYDDQVLVIIESFSHSNILVNTYCFGNKTEKDLANEMSKTIGNKPTSIIHMLFQNSYTDIHNFLEELSKCNSTLKITGGMAGDVLHENIPGYVFTENGIVEDGVITASIYGNNIKTFTEVNISHTSISTSYTANKCDNSLILEIENRPAVDWCKEQFGIDNFLEYPDCETTADTDALLRFPLILEGHGSASRFIKYNAEENNMSLYSCKINSNTKFRIGYTSPIACAQQCFDICNHMLESPIESLFCYSCFFRKLYLENCADWELRPFLNANICGVFMMGEIGFLNGKNEFLNGSCSMIGIADSEVYFKPDFTVFEDLYKIKDDNKRLVNYVFQKQSTVMSKENEELIRKLFDRQKKENEMIYVDSNTGIANSFKYSQDNLTYCFNKMCIINVENFDLLIAVLGQEGYFSLLRKIISEAKAYIDSSRNKNIFYYILNNSTLFITANSSVSDSSFLQIIDDYYERYQIAKVSGSTDLLINRFVLVMHQKDLLFSGLATLQKCKNLQTHFLISNDSTIDTPEFNDEMKMINILNYVIEQKNVIPYFQGIYSNTSKKINKYESLMRIKDIDGKIHLPGSFMNIAKKYHMYGSLSKLMIEKVFSLFAGKEQSVAINLSVCDINYDDMQDFIFSLSEKYKPVNNFIFEIVEDENLGNMDKLKPFIDKVRNYGIKIAIDDFGSGYSNFVEILMLEPDYIKIDMSIVKNIDTNIINQKVLKNISFLGKQLNAQLIAEGVETIEIQEKIENMEVQYSQGFLFSRPTPFHNLSFI